MCRLRGIGSGFLIVFFCFFHATLNAETLPPDDAPGVVEQPAPVLGTQVGGVERKVLSPSIRAIPANIGGGKWLAQGPGPALNGQVENISPNDEVSGAIHTVVAHPTDANILYAGGTNAGIWKTTNGTDASPFWTPLTDQQDSLSIGALEFDPTDVMSHTLVAGIGRYSSFDSLGGSRTGVLRTIDGGATWTASTDMSGRNISGVAPRGSVIVASVNVANPFFCSNVGIFRSTNSGSTFSKLSTAQGVPDGVAFDLASDAGNASVLYTGIVFGALCTSNALTNGIYKSSNTGATWSKISNAAMDALIVDSVTNNIEIDANGNNVVVNIIQNGQTAGIFHSGNGGTSWTQMDLPVIPQTVPAAVTNVVPGSPIVIDTGIAHGLNGNLVAISGVMGTTGANGVFYTTPLSATTFFLNGSSDVTPYTSGGTWSQVGGLNPRNKPGSQGGRHAAIRIDPSTPSTLYVGGDRQDLPFPNFIGANDFTGNLQRGNTLVAAVGTAPSPQWDHLTHSDSIAAIPGGGTASSSAPHADAREMVFDANGNLIEGDDGGVYRRTSPSDNTGDWFSINGNIQPSEIHDVAYDAVSNIIISGNQDTGTTQQQTPDSLTWGSVSTADGGDVAVDDTSVASMSTRYSSFQNLGAFRRIVYDHNNVPQSISFPTLFVTSGSALSVRFLTPVVLNAIDQTRLIIGGCNAPYESLDKADTIRQVTGLVSVCAFPQNAIAYGGKSGGLNNLDVLYIGDGNDIYIRTAAFPAALVQAATYPGAAIVRDIVLDPDDWTHAFVIDFANVFMTTDTGATWTNMTGNLTDTEFRSIEFLPGTTDRIAVGTGNGVFVQDLPAAAPFDSWGQLGTGLPNAPVWDMEYDPADDVLVVGTLGRGAWRFQQDGDCGFPENLLVRNEIVSASRTDTACKNINIAADFTVEGAMTKYTAVAGSKITISPGFYVKKGSQFSAQTGLGVTP